MHFPRRHSHIADRLNPRQNTGIPCLRLRDDAHLPVQVPRDLLLDDQAALYAALRNSEHVVFVFDRNLPDGLPRRDRRVGFICQKA